MTVREIEPKDAENFLELLISLDNQTETMMYMPGERARSKSAVESTVRQLSESGSLLLAAEENNRLIGFLTAERGQYLKIRHSAYIVVGVLPAFQRKGAGTRLLGELISRARISGISRLELTVMVNNEKAVRLYERNGFIIEGVRKKSMRLKDGFADEYYMARLIDYLSYN